MDVTVLDGGTGQELVRRAAAAPTPLWSAQVMLDEPDLVRSVHADFLRAGADVITLNTYSATRCRLGPAGLEHEYEPLQRRAGELARTARDDVGGSALIAGCLSPYGWSYRPELAPPYDELWPMYAETAALQAPYVDLFVCETMGSIDEARAAMRGASDVGAPVWVAWTILDDDSATLRSGEPLADAVRAADEWDSVRAVLVNCSTPEAVDAALPTLARSRHPFGAYANGFPPISGAYLPGSLATDIGARPEIDVGRYATHAERWLAGGATIVGGCCEIGPAHIAEIRRRVDERSKHHA